MADWRNTTSTGAGVLRPEALAAHAALRRYPSDGPLGHWVENYWSLEWDLADGATFDSATLPHPACHLSVERGPARPGVGPERVVVSGVVTRRFDVSISGRGSVVAAKFRPGGLAAMSGRGVRGIRDTVAPASACLPPVVVARLDELDDLTPIEDRVAAMEAALLDVDPPIDSRYDQLLEIIADTLADRSVSRVAEMEHRHHLSTRSLERLFDHYVGVSPKWVLARYRLHDAVTDLDAGYDGPLAALAASLGWYDEAHFNRDFAAMVGTTPGQYRARRRPDEVDGG